MIDRLAKEMDARLADIMGQDDEGAAAVRVRVLPLVALQTAMDLYAQLDNMLQGVAEDIEAELEAQVPALLAQARDELEAAREMIVGSMLGTPEGPTPKKPDGPPYEWDEPLGFDERGPLEDDE
jgi:hypothetical protein